MDAYSAEGMWWRPEAPQHRVPGTLTSDEDDVQLVVYGPLGPSIPSKDGVVRIEGSPLCQPSVRQIRLLNR
jgi:hypothetical protein